MDGDMTEAEVTQARGGEVGAAERLGQQTVVQGLRCREAIDAHAQIGQRQQRVATQGQIAVDR